MKCNFGVGLSLLLVAVSQAGWSQVSEQLIANGFEPTICADRRVGVADGNKRIQLLWMTDSGGSINWRISHNLGVDWVTTTYSAGLGAFVDPVGCSLINRADDPHHMYFGWLTSTSGGGYSPGDNFIRSISGTSTDNAATINSGNVFDRPWLVCNQFNLFLSCNYTGLPYVKQADIPSGRAPLVGPPARG